MTRDRLRRALLRGLFTADLGAFVDVVPRAYYALKHRADWTTGDFPHFFDHRIDRARWSESRRSGWLDRGVLNRVVISRGATVLDVGCGDGFYDRHFYSLVAGAVDAVDVDGDAIAFARKVHGAPNVVFSALDAASDPLPRASYDVVIADQCMQYMEPAARARFLQRAAATCPAGVVCGSTGLAPAPRADLGERSHIASEEAFARELSAAFAWVSTRTIDDGERTLTYFRASTAAAANRFPL